MGDSTDIRGLAGALRTPGLKWGAGALNPPEQRPDRPSPGWGPGAPGHRARVSAPLLPAHEILQHRALAGALAAYHSDLRQVEVRILADGGEGVL